MELIFFFQAADGLRDCDVTGVQACALPICWGLTSYPSSEVELIKGRNSKELPGLLGHYYGAEVIHRNNMALREPGAIDKPAGS